MPRSDMFLKAVGRSSGAVQGESVDRQFRGQIDVVEWSWSGERVAMTETGRRAVGTHRLDPLKVVKRVDAASTALIHSMSVNEEFSEFELTVRKAGGAEPLPFFVVTLTGARVRDYEVHSVNMPDGPPELLETLSFSFTEITLEHTPQTATGGGGGGSSVTLHTQHG
jgi:type VI secretion system secreted protein Hcp